MGGGGVGGLKPSRTSYSRLHLMLRALLAYRLLLRSGVTGATVEHKIHLFKTVWFGFS